MFRNGCSLGSFYRIPIRPAAVQKRRRRTRPCLRLLGANSPLLWINEVREMDCWGRRCAPIHCIASTRRGSGQHGRALGRRLRPESNPMDRFNVGAVVVNLTGQGASSRAMTLGKRKRIRTHLQVAEWNSAQQSAAKLLAQVKAGKVSPLALVWIPLMQGATIRLSSASGFWWPEASQTRRFARLWVLCYSLPTRWTNTKPGKPLWRTLTWLNPRRSAC